MGRELLPGVTRYWWTQVDHDVAQAAIQGRVSGVNSYVTPYRILAASLSQAELIPVGEPSSAWLDIGSKTNERAYLDKFRPEGFAWQRVPPDVPIYTTIRGLCNALLQWCSDHKSDIFPRDMYDLSRPNRQGRASGDIPIEKLLFDFWLNSDYRFACSELNRGRAEGARVFDWTALLDVPTSVGKAKLQYVLAREVITTSRAVAPTPQATTRQVMKEPQRPDGRTYPDYLNKAKDKLKSVGFGRCEVAKEKDAPPPFDAIYWDLEADTEDQSVNGVRLVLKDGHDASEAIDAIIAWPERWSLDCGQFVQVLQMYARLHMLGPRTWSQEVGKLRLRYRNSSGRGVYKSFYAEMVTGGGAAPLSKYSGKLIDPAGHVVEADTVLADAPIGSQVVWTKPNEAQENSNPWQSENAIKIGPDSYWGHGLLENPYSRHDLEVAYGKHGEPGDVFISGVDYVSHPEPDW